PGSETNVSAPERHWVPDASSVEGSGRTVLACPTPAASGPPTDSTPEPALGPAKACVTASAGTSTSFQAPPSVMSCPRLVLLSAAERGYSRPTLGTNPGPAMRQVRRGRALTRS